MTRAELYEGVAKAAYSQYLRVGAVGNVAGEISKAVRAMLSPLEQRAKCDRNVFRRKALYSQPMELSLKSNKGLVSAMFNLYKGRDKAPRLQQQHWEQLLRDLGLMGRGCRVPEGDAKLLCIWSQLIATSGGGEGAAAGGSHSLKLQDFMEALARQAAYVIPTAAAEQLREGAAGWQHSPHLNSSGAAARPGALPAVKQAFGEHADSLAGQLLGMGSGPSQGHFPPTRATALKSLSRRNHLPPAKSASQLQPRSGGVADSAGSLGGLSAAMGGCSPAQLEDAFEELMQSAVTRLQALHGGKDAKELAAIMLRKCREMGADVSTH